MRTQILFFRGMKYSCSVIKYLMIVVFSLSVPTLFIELFSR